MASSWRSRLTAGLAVLALLVVMQLAFEAGQASVGGGDDDADAGSSDAAGPGDPGREAQNSAFSRSAEQPSGPDDDGTTRPLPWQPVDGLQQPQSRGDGGDVSRRGDAATDFQGSVSAESLPGNESGPRDSGSRDESRSSSASSDGSDVSAAPDDGSKESSSEASHSGVASASGSVGGSDDSGDGSENLASGSAATDASGSSSSSSHMQDDSGSVGSSETRSSQEGSASSDHEDASSSGLRSDASRAAPADSAGDECRADIREREGRCCSEIPSGYTWLNDTFPKKPPTEPWQALDMVKSPDGEVLATRFRDFHFTCVLRDFCITPGSTAQPSKHGWQNGYAQIFAPQGSMVSTDGTDAAKPLGAYPMKTYPHLKCGKRYAVRVQVVPGFHPPNSVEWHEGMTLFTSSVPSWHIGHFYQEAGRLHEFLLTRHLFQTNEYPNGLPEPAGVVSLDHERGPLPEYHRLMFDAAVGERDGKPGLNMTFFGDLSGSRLKPNRKTHCFREAVLGYANRDFRTIDNRHPYPKHGTPGNEEVWLWYFISKQTAADHRRRAYARFGLGEKAPWQVEDRRKHRTMLLLRDNKDAVGERSMENPDAVQRILESHGAIVERVTLNGDVPASEQARAFADSAVIVSITGAHLEVGTQFMRPGTVVVELVPERYWYVVTRNLGRAFDLETYVTVGADRHTDGTKPKKWAGAQLVAETTKCMEQAECLNKVKDSSVAVDLKEFDKLLFRIYERCEIEDRPGSKVLGYSAYNARQAGKGGVDAYYLDVTSTGGGSRRRWG